LQLPARANVVDARRDVRDLHFRFPGHSSLNVKSVERYARKS
jgi:hypothetical protein